MEFLLEADKYWPEIPTETLGIRDGVLVPPSRLDDPEVVTFGGSAVLTPGWINCHAHLELSGAGAVSFNGDFSDWLGDVLEFKNSLTKQRLIDDYRSGCRELVQSGVARVIDHCNRTDLLLEETNVVPPHVVVFKELTGFGEEAIREAKEAVDEFLRRVEEIGIPDYGIALHAPYTVHPRVYEYVRQQLDSSTAVSTHLHEVNTELEFAENGTGSITNLLQHCTNSVRINPSYNGTRPLPYLVRGNYLKKPVTFGVHLNYLNDEDYRWLEASSIRPVFCPVHYDSFDHGSLPVTEWIERDLPFGLGTGVAASNGSFDMLDELRKLNSLTGELPSEKILSALTRVPAEGLGIPDRGVLTWGTPADLSVFEVESGSLEGLARGEARALVVLRNGEPAWIAPSESFPQS